MLRKLTLGFVAASAVAIAALAPTSASAFGGHWHGGGGYHAGWHGGWRGGPRFFAPRVVVGGPCVVRRLVPTLGVTGTSWSIAATDRISKALECFARITQPPDVQDIRGFFWQIELAQIAGVLGKF